MAEQISTIEELTIAKWNEWAVAYMEDGKPCTFQMNFGPIQLIPQFGQFPEVYGIVVMESLKGIRIPPELNEIFIMPEGEPPSTIIGIIDLVDGVFRFARVPNEQLDSREK